MKSIKRQKRMEATIPNRIPREADQLSFAYLYILNYQQKRHYFDIERNILGKKITV